MPFSRITVGGTAPKWRHFRAVSADLASWEIVVLFAGVSVPVGESLGGLAADAIPGVVGTDVDAALLSSLRPVSEI